MKINKYLIIFLLFVIIIILCIYIKNIYNLIKKKKNNNLELFTQDNNTISNIGKILKNFNNNEDNNNDNDNDNDNNNNNDNNDYTSDNDNSSNNEKSKNNFLNNLIKNGNFEGGKNILNYAGQNGINNIIKMKNPGNSQYVLEQKKSDTLTYYEIICNNEPNSKYNLYSWISIYSNNKKTINDIDLKNLIKIRIQNKDYTNYIPTLNYDILKKVELQNDKTIWYLVKFNFISTPSTSDKMYIYLNYSKNFIFDSIYFCELSLFKVLIDAENFIYNDKLICYTDANNYETNTTTWHDLSGNGNDLFWSAIPNVNISKGYINTNNTKLKCFPSKLLSNKEFSIIICLNKDNIMKESNKDKNNETYLLSIPGNSNYFIELKINNDNLNLIVGKDTYNATNKLILYNKTFINIIYQNGILNIYQDNIPIITQKIDKPSLNDNSIIINRNNNLNINLYSILFYNRKVKKEELELIKDYFLSNKNKNNKIPDVNNFILSFLDTPLNLLYNEIQNDFIKPFNKKNNTENNFNDDNSNFGSLFGNNDYRFKYNKDKCKEDCDNKCSIFLNNSNKNNYDSCISDCANNIDSCKSYCSEKNSDSNSSKYCKNNNSRNSNIENNKGNNKGNNNFGNNNNSDCPTVYKKDNNFMIKIDKNSKYYNSFRKNDISYGSDINKAKYLYHLNYPKCSIPDQLINAFDDNINTCRFTINENNPCYTNSCAGVNWNIKNYKDLNLNDKCKKAVSHYCQINNNIDDECYCWKPEYKDDEKCISIRKYFENPLDYCDPKNFNIEDHPDFKNYIKKDSIPCWGCNLDE
jgi:hypothetical protein